MYQEHHGERHIYGPPGCGKTTRLTQLAVEACQRFRESKVRIFSFTRAAKKAFSFDSQPCHPEVSTLHSVCYRMLGKPTIAEANVEDFNKCHPEYELTPDVNPGHGHRPIDDELPKKQGDRLYAERERLRATCTPKDQWPARAAEFDRVWTDFKRANKLLDFSDLIEFTTANFAEFDGSPEVVFIDEAQDLSRSEIRLARKLCGRGKTDYYVFALDDDQTIYSFKGSTPEDLVGSVPPERMEFLDQSHRVPRLIQHRSQRWIEKVAVRQPKVYRPRHEVGEVRRCSATYREPEAMLKGLETYLSDGKEVMILASCGYMLDNIIACLARHGIPFHNPYRESKFEWNPLDLPDGRTSDADRVRALLRCDPTSGRLWAPGELKSFLKPLSPDVYRKSISITAIPPEVSAAMGPSHSSVDGDRIVEALSGSSPVGPDMLRLILEPQHSSALLSGNALDWFWDNLASKERGRTAMKLVANICRKRGGKALDETPRLTIGTIHSVKGGEADVVYLFPDISSAGLENWSGRRERRDPIRRLFYVAMTRTKESLIICDSHKPKFSVEGL